MGVNLPGGLFEERETDDDTGVILSDFKGVLNKGAITFIDDNAMNQTKTVYSVAAGKTLFLIFVELSGKTAAGGVADDAYFGFDTDLLMHLRTEAVASKQTQMTTSFPIPLRIAGGTDIKLVAGGNNVVSRVTAVGYLI